MTTTEIVAHVLVSLAVGIIVGTLAWLRGYERGISSGEDIWRSSLKHVTGFVADYKGIDLAARQTAKETEQ